MARPYRRPVRPGAGACAGLNPSAAPPTRRCAAAFAAGAPARPAAPANASPVSSGPQPNSESTTQPRNFPIRGYHGRAFVPNAHQAELDHGDWTGIWGGSPPPCEGANSHHQPPTGAKRNKNGFSQDPPKEIAWFRSRLEPILLRVSVQLVRTDFFTEPARARRQDEMQPVPVIPCREETTARVDVLRRRPHAGRWER